MGIATFAFNGLPSLDGRWHGRALRYFSAGSAGAAAGRLGTNFLERALLPDGPGGALLFEVAYTSDVTADRTAGKERGTGTAAGSVASAVIGGGEGAGTSGQQQEQRRSVELVRGLTTPVSCAAAPLCDVQCAGVAQYEAWRDGCRR